MAEAPFKHVYSQLRLSSRSRPKELKDRVALLESELRDLRGSLRELIATLERELGRDLDRDRVVGRVSPKRPVMSKARLEPLLPPSRRQRPKPLPPNIP
jgi:hypothetical protein